MKIIKKMFGLKSFLVSYEKILQSFMCISMTRWDHKIFVLTGIESHCGNYIFFSFDKKVIKILPRAYFVCSFMMTRTSKHVYIGLRGTGIITIIYMHRNGQDGGIKITSKRSIKIYRQRYSLLIMVVLLLKLLIFLADFSPCIVRKFCSV